MKAMMLTVVLCLVWTIPAWSEMVVKPVVYSIDGEAYEGVLVFNAALSDVRPGVVMVPNWMGPSEQSIEKAARVAGEAYVVFMIDMYGQHIRPTNTEEAAAAAGKVRSDREVMRKRVNAGLRTFKGLTDQAPLDASRMAAIGFCFGGGTVLELARSGTELNGVVSFHGNLDTPDTADAENIATKVLVLHGADDPLVPDQQVMTFIQEMRDAKVDWQLIHYGGAVHSFTDPYAAMPGTAEYHPVVAQRAFAAMEHFFDELFHHP